MEHGMFERLDQEVINVEDELLAMEITYVHNPTEENTRELSKSRVQLSNKFKVEEDNWQQKANIKWIKDGDYNAKFSIIQSKTRHRSYVFTGSNIEVVVGY